MTTEIKIAAIGDVHHRWDAVDVAWFNDSDYDLILFVGDLGGYTHRGGLAVARSISALQKPTLVIPGNHDGVHALQLLGEIAPRAKPLRRTFGHRQTRRCVALDRCLGPVTLAGYSHHAFTFGGRPLNVIAARPHTMGGPRIAFKNYMRKRFNVSTLQDSVARLTALVDRCDDAPIVFLAHNGPAGLGDTGADIWGADFNPKLGDWGDPDLTDAVAYARNSGRTVLAVVAGHMHLTTKKGKRRPWHLERDGVHYVNSARVPRHRQRDEGMVRHHVSLRITGTDVSVQERYV